MDVGFTLGNSDYEGDDDLIIHRIDSGDIIYSNPTLKYKLVGPYVIGNKLGEGSYAKVKECLHSETLQRCAVKIMKQKNLRRIPHGIENVEREIKLLRKLKHNNCIRLFDVHINQEKGKIYMMMDYCVTGLQELLDSTQEKKFPIWQAHGYFLQLIDGLEYLHCQGVVHKDIKPGNLLLTCDSILKITDFGVAEQVDILQGNDLITHSQGSPMFQPPEVASGTDTLYPGFKLDVWSSGCTLFNITTGSYPFNGSNIFRIFESVCQDALVIPSELEEPLGDLLKGMLIKDPYKRSSLQEVKAHRWVQKASPPPEKNNGQVSLWGKNGDPHSCSVFEYLRSHHFPEETQQYMTERELNAAETAGGVGLFSSSVANNPSHQKRKRRNNNKPTSCITFRNLANCSQS